jgi:hypothetical protein
MDDRPIGSERKLSGLPFWKGEYVIVVYFTGVLSAPVFCFITFLDKITYSQHT